jgi:hypothetical protein
MRFTDQTLTQRQQLPGTGEATVPSGQIGQRTTEQSWGSATATGAETWIERTAAQVTRPARIILFMEILLFFYQLVRDDPFPGRSQAGWSHNVEIPVRS